MVSNITRESHGVETRQAVRRASGIGCLLTLTASGWKLAFCPKWILTVSPSADIFEQNLEAWLRRFGVGMSFSVNHNRDRLAKVDGVG